MHSPPSVRSQKSQNIEQPLTGGHWNPPEKNISHPRIKEKPQQDGRRCANTKNQISHLVCGNSQTRDQVCHRSSSLLQKF